MEMTQPIPRDSRFNWELGAHTVHRHDLAAHQHLQMAESYFVELEKLEAELSADDGSASVYQTMWDNQRAVWLRWRTAHHRQMGTLHASLARVHPEWAERNS